MLRAAAPRSCCALRDAAAPGARLATGPEMALALDQAIRKGTGAFVLDLNELEFLDSSGVGVLLRARAGLVREARPLVIVCPPGPVRRVIEIAGLDRLLLLYDSHADVPAALDPSA